MSTKRKVCFKLNGGNISIEVTPETTLLRALRGETGATSPKRGCEEGECGTCTVLVNGIPMKSCLLLAVEIEGREIITSEGLISESGDLHPVQKAFISEGGIQCGFCTPGMVVTSKALLDKNSNPSEDEIRIALAGNLCRCTGYIGIVKSVKKAAEMLSKTGGEAE